MNQQQHSANNNRGGEEGLVGSRVMTRRMARATDALLMPPPQPPPPEEEEEEVADEAARRAENASAHRVSLHPLFQSMNVVLEEERAARERQRAGESARTAIQRHMGNQQSSEAMNGLKRIQLCRSALDALDRRGWDRSFHQRMFHEEYLKSCARIFFKRDGPGAFARNHNRVLEFNGWDSTPQEILVSTPRRFGKTISVSMFAAAILFAAPGIEMSIYSTCKRISQKMLRNIVKFLDLIYLELGVAPYKVLRLNSEVFFFFFFFLFLRDGGGAKNASARRRCTSAGRRGTETCASSTRTHREPLSSSSFLLFATTTTSSDTYAHVSAGKSVRSSRREEKE